MAKMTGYLELSGDRVEFDEDELGPDVGRVCSHCGDPAILMRCTACGELCRLCPTQGADSKCPPCMADE